MTLDWFTVVAQIINFVVLIALLYRLLYGPIVKAMKEREEKIATRLHEAEEMQRQAEVERANFQQKNAAFDAQRGQRLAEMEEEVDARRSQLLEEARHEVDGLKEQWEQSLQREREKFLDELERRVSAEVFSIVRHALGDMADAELEAQVVSAFLRNIQAEDSQTWQDFQASLSETRSVVVVRSAFDLPQELQQAIEQVLRNGDETADQESARKLHVRFTTNPHLVAGLELEAQSNIAAWNLRDYLQALKERVTGMLDAGSESSHESAPGTGVR